MTNREKKLVVSRSFNLLTSTTISHG